MIHFIFMHVHGCMCSSICSWVSEHQVIQRHFILGASQTKVLLSLPPQAVLLRQEELLTCGLTMVEHSPDELNGNSVML